MNRFCGAENIKTAPATIRTQLRPELGHADRRAQDPGPRRVCARQERQSGLRRAGQGSRRRAELRGAARSAINRDWFVLHRCWRLGGRARRPTAGRVLARLLFEQSAIDSLRTLQRFAEPLGMLAAGLGHVGLAAAATADDFGGAADPLAGIDALALPGRG